MNCMPVRWATFWASWSLAIVILYGKLNGVSSRPSFHSRCNDRHRRGGRHLLQDCMYTGPSSPPFFNLGREYQNGRHQAFLLSPAEPTALSSRYDVGGAHHRPFRTAPSRNCVKPASVRCSRWLDNLSHTQLLLHRRTATVRQTIDFCRAPKRGGPQPRRSMCLTRGHCHTL